LGPPRWACSRRGRHTCRGWQGRMGSTSAIVIIVTLVLYIPVYRMKKVIVTGDSG
jgi:hypothetical protein